MRIGENIFLAKDIILRYEFLIIRHIAYWQSCKVSHTCPVILCDWQTLFGSCEIKRLTLNMHIVVQVMLQLDLHLAETVVSMLDWGYRVIHDFGSMRTNQRPVSRSSDNSWPIRGQYSGHVVTLHQSEASIWIPWWLSTNQMQLTRSHNHSPPIRGQYPSHLISLGWSVLQWYLHWPLKK